MAIRVALHHVTDYRYDRLVSLSPQVIRLRPAPHCRTPICSYSQKVLPKDHFVNWQQDPFGNYQARLDFQELTRNFRIEIDLVAEMVAINPFDFFLTEYAEHVPFRYEASLLADLKPYMECEPQGQRFEKVFKRFRQGKKRTVDFLVEVNQCLEQEIDYVIRMEPGVQTPEETLEKGRGSCRDSAWLLVQILRHMGYAARFASGYLIQLKADMKSLDGPSGPKDDFTDLHAWTEIFLPGAGWVGLDPTSGLFAGEGHIPLACTPHPETAAPVTGAVSKSEVEFSHDMKVTRVYESPRVTRPYSEEQWQQILLAGNRIDESLRDMDVRLTMGGEPTFVSIDDMEGEEWNGAALGPNKRRLAVDLFGRMVSRFAPGGLEHYGQGKWYPGEPLPRWAFSCYWRKDNQPVWKNRDLIAEDNTNYGHAAPEAERFIQHLAELLGVKPKWAIPGYEDPYELIQKERRTPINIDPKNNNLDDDERRRVARILEKGLSSVVGYVLPLSKGMHGYDNYWLSGPWLLRMDNLFLIPGDSPMGYRLPLDSLLYQPEEEQAHIEQFDPSVIRPPLPSYEHLQSRRYPGPFEGYEPRLQRQSPTDDADQRWRPGWDVPSKQEGGPLPQYEELLEAARMVPPEDLPEYDPTAWVVRTALCVEPRDGRLRVFMPPARFLEHYLELVAAIEQTAGNLDLPVQIEGYHPPSDYRLNVFKVTPDPGVIEVNIHPAATWNELTSTTLGLYEDARHSRLGTEKFDLDGKHTGTEGGNHIVMGGETATDSPFLRRPDVLKSLVTYWNNHPSLSYLLSGTFIGPTSQAPRADEARHESVYELEIACQQLAEHDQIPPWLVDRLFRNLLIDVTGNTHRAEFCIDKLYSPDSSSGRLGLIEFRNFEMPPHERMSLTQQLLLRALVARFWKEPYEEKMVRWGTQLHDRFMLPHFVQQDFRDVVQFTREKGFPLDWQWFHPHYEFRFPHVGSTCIDGVDLELRSALEPWNVLGEEGVVGGTVRYVDSSVERMQVKVTGMTNPRHVLTCNGRRVPLHPTGQQGQFVAGIRYRAWQPPSCLHPTIPVHTPLVLDLYDQWSNRSLGGCTYHVSHPGGRSYDTFPVNALEAESRRHNRFFPFGHTPGAQEPPSEERNRDYPFTLDLRRAPGLE